MRTQVCVRQVPKEAEYWSIRRDTCIERNVGLEVRALERQELRLVAPVHCVCKKSGKCTRIRAKTMSSTGRGCMNTRHHSKIASEPNFAIQLQSLKWVAYQQEIEADQLEAIQGSPQLR